MSSELIVDELTGRASAGSIAVTAEGGTVTTSLQQGLAKTWANFTGISTTALRDSFNVTSLTDTNTGRTTVTIANDMSNVNYAGSYYNNGATGSAATSVGNNYAGGLGDRATGTLAVASYIQNNYGDVYNNDVIIFGDLA